MLNMILVLFSLVEIVSMCVCDGLFLIVWMLFIIRFVSICWICMGLVNRCVLVLMLLLM